MTYRNSRRVRQIADDVSECRFSDLLGGYIYADEQGLADSLT